MHSFMGQFVPLLALLVLVLLAPAAQAGERGDALVYADHLAVYDGFGTQVGSSWVPSDGFFPGVGFMYVEFRHGSTPVIVRLRTDGFQFDAVRFSQRGCTGDALFDADWYHSAVAAPHGTVYLHAGPLRQRTVKSTLNTRGRCITHEPYRANTVPLMATTVHLADYFVPPFVTRTRGRTPVPRGAP
jgi:hypothetical protein